MAVHPAGLSEHPWVAAGGRVRYPAAGRVRRYGAEPSGHDLLLEQPDVLDFIGTPACEARRRQRLRAADEHVIARTPPLSCWAIRPGAASLPPSTCGQQREAKSSVGSIGRVAARPDNRFPSLEGERVFGIEIESCARCGPGWPADPGPMVACGASARGWPAAGSSAWGLAGAFEGTVRLEQREAGGSPARHGYPRRDLPRL
jgi:hypothetical protein